MLPSCDHVEANSLSGFRQFPTPVLIFFSFYCCIQHAAADDDVRRGEYTDNSPPYNNGSRIKCARGATDNHLSKKKECI
ncbi:hypothetical protein DPMN_075231 [Dreissena polymorpha]|uniref:Uncharacterized protein n=1 Tax=Dreissena polymorpha TaxID=45954 RepID=A0A9D3YL97_DREPO|nr:hypothetical protein DPMN_075231 [Dreissena polymorpha]